MQAFTDVPVSCCDCKKTFLSASSLLQHFAEHVKIKLAKDNYNKLKLISKRSYRKCFLNNNNNNHNNNNSDEDGDSIRNHVGNIITEGYVQDKKDLYGYSPVVSNSDTTKKDTLIFIEDKSGDTSSIASSSEHQFNSNNDCMEDVQACKSPLHETQAKKSDSLISDPSTDVFNNNVTVNEDSDGKQFCVEFNSEKMLINIERLTHVTTKDRKDKKIITTNEVLNDDYDKFDDNNLKRKLSNRKQTTPKKIERSLVALVKIAPKPKNMPPQTRDIHSKPKQKKKYSCHLCSKTFGWSTDLKRHILVHTGERPFKCNKCDACFTRNFLLQKHKNKIHSNNKDTLEKNKLLEEKVNENLKQLKTKLNELSKSNFSEDCALVNLDEDEEKPRKSSETSEVEDDLKDEEMIYSESKLDIKEETNDPLSFSIDLHQSINQQHYVNGNWILANNNNNNNNNNDIIEEKVIKDEAIHRIVLVETTDKT